MRSHFLLWSFVEICETIFLLIILDICFWMKHRIVSCAKCRCQYELVLGDIVSIESEEISMDITAWERGLRYVKLMKQSIPAAVHSIVVQTPSGLTRTHRFATETVDLPAQEGERVTVAVAALSNVYRKVGPFKFSPRAPDFYPENTSRSQ
ncbi:hypothetical protein GLYMA_05G217051v4 [Glycine max]|nr:hypothetical protein GLYMA_05G217051v4 [Glycine max]KAH1135663.1 hypothetical protein GYH30_013411 [Glycine max]